MKSVNSALARAAAVFLIFALLSPLIQILVSGAMSHFYYGGGIRHIFSDIGMVFRAWDDAVRESPWFILANWAPAFTAALWAAWRAGQRRLTLLSAALGMALAGLFWGIIFLPIFGDEGGFWQANGFYMGFALLTDALQWLISAAACYAIARACRLTKRQ